MGIERFEDIDAWKKARELTNDIYKATSKDAFGKDFGLKDQIRRAAVSIMANIAEGFGCDSNKEFARFLSYSYRSALEVQSHLYISLDSTYISKDEFNEIYQKAVVTIKLIKGFSRYLNKEKK